MNLSNKDLRREQTIKGFTSRSFTKMRRLRFNESKESVKKKNEGRLRSVVFHLKSTNVKNDTLVAE